MFIRSESRGFYEEDHAILRRSKLNASPLLLILFLLTSSGIAAARDGRVMPCVWIGPDDQPLPFKTYSEIEDFLSSARVLSKETIPVGVTKPEKLLLEKNGVRMNAVFRTVDVFKQKWMSKEGLKMNFRDHYRFERAAYELGRILGVRNIPPVVLRTIDKKKGSLQAWVEGAITEQRRIENGQAPPRSLEWIHQLHFIRVFDNLIWNDDRNRGNILIDKDWRLWMIDATRAFRIDGSLMNPERIRFCPKDFYQNLKTVKEEDLRARLHDTELLTPGEFRTLLERRKKLLDYLSGLITAKGEDAVLF
jgi:hypothetical protein